MLVAESRGDKRNDIVYYTIAFPQQRMSSYWSSSRLNEEHDNKLSYQCSLVTDKGGTQRLSYEEDNKYGLFPPLDVDSVGIPFYLSTQSLYMS